MFTFEKEYKKHLNTLSLGQELKHIDNTMNKLKELYYSDDVCNKPKKLLLIKSILVRLEILRSCIKENNKPPIDPSVNFIINEPIWRSISDIESNDQEEYIPTANLRYKLSDFLKNLKYTIPAHYGYGMFCDYLF